MSRIIMHLFLLLSVVGCASAPPTERAETAELAWPAPADATLDFTIDLDVPPELAAELKIPQSFKGVINGVFHAEATSVRPMTSKYLGTMTFKVTDRAEQKVFASHSARIEGSGSGEPGSQLRRLSALYTDAWTAVAAQIQSASPAPATNPTTQRVRFAPRGSGSITLTNPVFSFESFLKDKDND